MSVFGSVSVAMTSSGSSSERLSAASDFDDGFSDPGTSEGQCGVQRGSARESELNLNRG